MTDLELYENFHRNYFNKLIHLIGIPTLVWSVFLYTHRINIIFFRGSTLIFIYYLCKYYKIDKVRFMRLAIFYYTLYGYSFDTYKKYSKSITKNISIKYFMLGWILKLIGHYVFEGNSPALLSGLKNSLTIGPYFAYRSLEEILC